MIGEKGPERRPPAKGQEQQIAGDHRRHDERQVDDPVEDGFSPEPPARQDKRDQYAKRQARQHCPKGNLKAEINRVPFFGAEFQPSHAQFVGAATSVVKPCSSKIALAFADWRYFTNSSASALVELAVTPTG